MSDRKNRQIRLRSRPVGEPKESDFELVESPIPEPGPGQFLSQTIYLSLDPYMRGRMSGAPSLRAAGQSRRLMAAGIIVTTPAR